ncbi:S-type pyocin domain-containing protein [Pseudomonas sp. RC10]|uniref:S-type pyocin domain-containing protein n=1 Tax=Pseudomonas bambusae TaxID=3139142 RepID=UPI00313A0D71
MPNQIELPPIVIRPDPPPTPSPIIPTFPIDTLRPLPMDPRLSHIASIEELAKKVSLRSEEAVIPLCGITKYAMESIDALHAEHIQNLQEDLAKEITMRMDESALPLSEHLLLKRSIIQDLIASKNSSLQLEIQISNSFFGISPLNRNFVDVVNEIQRRKNPLDVFKAWTTSYTAARSVAVLTDAIRILTEQSAALDAQISAAQAQQQEQAALAAAQAQRLAEEQAQMAAQAAAQAQRQAEEQAAQAAAEAQRQAEEQERLAVEEKHRLENQATAAGLANTYHLKGAVSVTRPLFITTEGVIAVAETTALTLQAAIRAAIAGLTAAAASVASGLFVGVSALIYSPKLGNGELSPNYAFSTPLSDILPEDTQDLHAVAAAEGSIELPFRLSSKTTDQGDSELIVVNIGASNLHASVKVVAATHNSQSNTFSVQISDTPPKTLIWTPAEAPANSSTTLPVEEQVPSVIPGASVTPVEGRIDTFPQVAEISFNDLIVTFPIETRLPPIYVMVSNPYEGANTKGKYSGRMYNPDNAGGPIKNLSWEDAIITQEGIDLIKLHTGRFKESAGNSVMIDRLNKILEGKIESTDVDKRFYTHEIRELERYRALGVKDEVEGNVWNDAHAATLEDFKLKDDPDLLYTAEATDAYLKQEYGE